MCIMDKLVFIVNGKPRAGKDTFAEILNRYMKVYILLSLKSKKLQPYADGMVKKKNVIENSYTNSKC